jgi:hypothetical protein
MREKVRCPDKPHQGTQAMVLFRGVSARIDVPPGRGMCHTT